MIKKYKKLNISIIGLGKFGTLTACILSKHANIFAYHYKDNKKNRELARRAGAKFTDLKTASKCDIIILTAPISKTEEIIKQISPLVRRGALVIDTCSVKTYPCGLLQKHISDSVEILGTHPMFGPITVNFNLEKKTYKLSGKQIVLCPLRIKKEKLAEIKNFLKELGLAVIFASPEENDRQCAMSHFLVHFLGRSLSAAGIREQKIHTPGFKNILKIFPHTITDDKWQLFFDMHNYNPYAKKIKENFFRACALLDEKIIESGANDKFDFMRKAIDNIDSEVMALLEKRFEYVKKIGKFKKKNNIKILDKKREQGIIKSKIGQTNLDKDFVKKLYGLIFNESYKNQK